MNNIQNGGLICQIGESIIHGNGLREIEVKGIHLVPWFINYSKSEETIYYSDAKKDNYLCKLDLNTSGEQVLLKESVYLLIKYKDKLYYINEKNGYLYSYHIGEKKVRQLTDEMVNTFYIKDEKLWYSNYSGIIQMTIEGQNKQRISKREAIRLIESKGTLFFIDKEEYAVCYISGEDLQKIEGSKATSINVYEDCIFYNHANDKSHIYRYSVDNEFNIKFIPERADHIHIIEDTIYYLNQDSKLWMHVPVHGGKPLPLTE